MIEVQNLTKRFGSTVAVDDLSFEVQPGRVTGFLGPNGSGKSTTMRCMVGLDRFENGAASFGGRQYRDFPAPLTEVGILLDAGYVHPARSGRNHLRWLAASNGLPKRRVDEVLELVGMTEVANRKLRGYSLGMKQRLGLAATLLGDPGTIILDEPANGLDPEGIRWIRDFLRHYADQGRSVFVSSHLLSEMSLLAQDLIVIGKGRLIQQSSVEDFVGEHATSWVRVRSPQLPELLQVLGSEGATVKIIGDASAPEGAEVQGLAIEQVGELAASTGATLYELSAQTESLEDAFLTATASTQEYRSGGAS
ncbi:MAG: ATP-binding cassette domain-containing protein [Ilumatobacter sp.]|uniref:ABC transporter ATP-binding protein n=1 Tax=Ilumatobacter sp. TaxID=1967498 RepID=UPI0026307BDA|nr:ATP-binding cassette domain-containing protein [Ilumatobacter sp.]MDJ0771481.1 ATP-binding cassette domain-containing protein [Ilumatobacter sp.]